MNAYVIDDDTLESSVIIAALQQWGFKAISERDPVAAVEYLKNNQPDLIVSDLNMPRMSGIDVLKSRREDLPNTAWIIMTGEGSISTSVEAIQLGADDYLLKPVDYDQLNLSVKKALKSRDLCKENAKLKKALGMQRTIIGNSSALSSVMEQIKKAAPSEMPIMIYGESGTGKELVARQIHALSNRSKGEFTGLDCVSLPKEIFESELFGFEKGAFTGAAKKRIGLLESSSGGTFFMDEITEMDYNLQAKLLRTLQERKFRRIGGNSTIDMDCRIVSATRRDPLKAISDGLFREDLFYRLNVIPIKVPPLRERKDDIPLLVQHFLEKAKSINGSKSEYKITSTAIDFLKQYDWPGNIRELENTINRMVIFCTDNTITENDLPVELKGHTVSEKSTESNMWSVNQPFKDAKEIIVSDFEKKYLTELLTQHKWNITEAAKVSGVNRKTFQRLISKHNLN